MISYVEFKTRTYLHNVLNRELPIYSSTTNPLNKSTYILKPKTFCNNDLKLIVLKNSYPWAFYKIHRKLPLTESSSSKNVDFQSAILLKRKSVTDVLLSTVQNISEQSSVHSWHLKYMSVRSKYHLRNLIKLASKMQVTFNQRLISRAG